MTLNFYVDAFNLYYGCLKDTPHKWLDLRAFFEATSPGDLVQTIHYCTARIRPNPRDLDKHVRQDVYLRALKTLPGLIVHEGNYSRTTPKMPLHPIPPPPGAPTIVRVVKYEEKGSDVNLATWLLLDAFDGACDAAVVVTNDSDLAEPIRQVRKKLGRRVLVLHTCSKPNRGPSIELRKAAGLRSGKAPLIVADALLATSQFPTTMRDATGPFHKPPVW